jgi:hypothetical protein
MNHREPPALATWILDHLTSRGSNEALSGDLLEAFRTGRSAGWYWYQVIVAIAIAWGQNVWHHRASLFLAAIWSLFSPAWRLLSIRFSESSLYGYIWRIPWPWSTACDLALNVMAPPLLFIWIGVAVYSTLHLLGFGKLPLRSVRKGFLWGFVAYALAWACLFAMPIYNPQVAGHAVHAVKVNWRSLTVLGVIGNFGTWNALVRLPYFIGTATTLWFLASRDKPEQVRTA